MTLFLLYYFNKKSTFYCFVPTHKSNRGKKNGNQQQQTKYIRLIFTLKISKALLSHFFFHFYKKHSMILAFLKKGINSNKLKTESFIFTKKLINFIRN